MKQRFLEDRHVKLIEQLNEDKGMTYKDIAEELNKDGFTWNTGRALTAVDISRFMRSHGVRKKREFSKGVKFKRSSGHMDDIREIMRSNLSEPLQEKLIRKLLGGRT